MIVDRLEQSALYTAVHPLLAAGFEFLNRPDLDRLSPGKVTIDGDRLFAIVSDDEGRGRELSLLEAHQRYLDIQYVVAGTDHIGWLPIAECERVKSEYDPQRDVAFYFDRPATWLVLPQGSFAIFLPQDAHAPLGGTGRVRKVVVKALLDQAV